MKLLDFAAGGGGPVAAIAADTELAMEVQKSLGLIGLLDPPADGKFGAVSRWALAELHRRVTGAEADDVVTKPVASALATPQPDKWFPVGGTKDFAGRIVQALQATDAWVCRHPGALNIVYLEGVDPDGSVNANQPNRFNDTRLLLSVREDGRPAIVAAWEATSEPGRHYTEIDPQSPLGAARIALGQHKAWVVGMHKSNTPGAHESLVQAEPLTVFRDFNKDYRREGDQPQKGIFGINQHWGFDLPFHDIGKASAGCLVGRTKHGHTQFMALVKQDPRFHASSGYRFLTTVLAGSKLG